MKQLLLAAFVVLGFAASALAQDKSASAPVIINGVTPDIGGTPLNYLYVDAGGHVGNTPCCGVPSGSSYLYNGLPIARAQTASYNYYFGNSGNLTGSGTNNVALGSGALTAVAGGSANVAIGGTALQTVASGNNNTAVGLAALRYETGSGNTAVGAFAANNLTVGGQNVAIGYYALSNATDPNNTIAIGYNALHAYVTGGAYNGNQIAIGANALALLTSGSENIAIGSAAMYAATTAYQSVSVGVQSLQAVTTGYFNTAVGVSSLGSETTGIYNTAIGQSSGYSLTTGSNNVLVGASAIAGVPLGITTGNNNTIIGTGVTGLSAGLSDAIILATGEGTIRADFGFTAASAWTMAFLAGTGSRPICVTSAGTLEAGSLSVGLTTCP